LFETERDLLCEVNTLKTSANESHSKVLRQFEEVDRFLTLIESRKSRLALLQSFRVHEDLFSISREGEFPVINSYRLGNNCIFFIPCIFFFSSLPGSTPAVPIEWEEINAALGEAALLLFVCGSKLNYYFRTFRPIALGEGRRSL
jgi:hypothetical protein